MKRLNYFIISSLIVLFVKCTDNPNSIKIEGELKELKAIRLDQALIESKSGEELHFKFSQYPELYKNFYSRMLQMGNSNDLFDTSKHEIVKQNLNQFLNDSTMQFIFKSLEKEFNNFNKYEISISKGFSRYNSLFNKKTNVTIGTFYSNFNATVLETDQIIWIGLDMYLGSQHPVIELIPSTSIPQYYKDKMEKKYIVSDVLFGYLMSTIYEPLGDEFLARMLAYGKIAYLMKLILPDEDEKNKFRYNKDDLNWCEQHETNIWQYIIDNNLLYEKDPSKINIFFSDGPYTKNFGKESPSGIGIWLGYKMILDYEKNTKNNPLEIISEKNIQKLLSTYEPN